MINTTNLNFSTCAATSSEKNKHITEDESIAKIIDNLVKDHIENTDESTFNLLGHIPQITDDEVSELWSTVSSYNKTTSSHKDNTVYINSPEQEELAKILKEVSSSIDNDSQIKGRLKIIRDELNKFCDTAPSYDQTTNPQENTAYINSPEQEELTKTLKEVSSSIDNNPQIKARLKTIRDELNKFCDTAPSDDQTTNLQEDTIYNQGYRPIIEDISDEDEVITIEDISDEDEIITIEDISDQATNISTKNNSIETIERPQTNNKSVKIADRIFFNFAINRFQCAYNFCNYSARHYYTINKHYKNVHIPGKVTQIKGKKLQIKGYVKNHITGFYGCITCNFSSKYSYNVRVHYKSKHM